MKFNGSSRQLREAVAQSGTVLAGVFILVLMQTTVLQHDLPVQDKPINLTLLAEADKPEKVIEPPVRKVLTPKSEKRVSEKVVATPAIVDPVQTSQFVRAQAAVVNEKANASVTETPLPVRAAEPVRTADVEAMYVAKIRGYLISAKRYPTGREASMRRPTGKSRVWFILRRNGELIDAGIEEGSGSMLLDGSALTTVRRASYTAFPDEAWAGQTQHKFSVELEFVPPPL
jgi:protein TonB